MTCPNKAAGGRVVADARVAFGVTVGHVDSNGQSLGVIVGNWGIGDKVVPIGARISNAFMMSWKHRRGIWNKFSH